MQSIVSFPPGPAILVHLELAVQSMVIGEKVLGNWREEYLVSTVCGGEECLCGRGSVSVKSA